jgi:hypothetical protein
LVGRSGRAAWRVRPRSFIGRRLLVPRGQCWATAHKGKADVGIPRRTPASKEDERTVLTAHPKFSKAVLTADDLAEILERLTVA